MSEAIPNQFANGGAGNPAPPPGTTATPAIQLDQNFNSTTAWVDTIAALRAFSSLTTQAVAVGAYATAGDGGGGLFVINPTDTTTADNGGTIIVDAGGSRWYHVFSGQVSVRWFGATGNGVTNDTAAINAALAYVVSLGGGVVYLPGGTYLVNTGALAVTSNGVSFLGDGEFVTTLITANGSGTILSFTGTSLAYLLGVGVQNMTIGRSVNPTIASGSTGLSMTYCNAALVQNVRSYNSVYQFFITDVITSLITACYAFRTADSQGAGDTYVGFRLVTTGTFGNQTTHFQDCFSVANSNDGILYGNTGYGFWLTGTAPHDEIYDTCEADNTTYGFYIDGTLSAGGLNWALKFHNCTSDTYGTAGYYILNMTNSDQIAITGGDLNSGNTGATNAGISCINVQGLIVNVVQFIGSNNDFGQGVYATNSFNINVQGCLFKFVAYPVFCDNTTAVVSDSNFSYNTIFTDALTGSGGHTIHAGFTLKGTTRSNFNGNTFSTNGTAAILSGFTLSNTPSHLNIQQNDMNPSFFSAQFTGLAAFTNVNISYNTNYNPVGVLGPPAVPLTTVAYTNAYGVDCTVYVSGAVTGVSVDGVALGASGTLIAQAFLVLAGQTITLTYGGATPTWVWIGK